MRVFALEVLGLLVLLGGLVVQTGLAFVHCTLIFLACGGISVSAPPRFLRTPASPPGALARAFRPLRFRRCAIFFARHRMVQRDGDPSAGTWRRRVRRGLLLCGDGPEVGE